jgi:hypothetical protein
MNNLATTADLRGPTALDRGAREALLRVVVGSGVSHNTLIMAFFAHEAYGSLDDYLEAVRKERGAEAEVDIRSEMRAMTERYTDDSRLDWEQAQRDASHIYGPIGLLLAMPEADFLTAIEAGIPSIRSANHVAALPDQLNKVCRRRGLVYRASGVGRLTKFEWTGDLTIAETAVTPALSALDDPRLANGAGVEFKGARDELREDTPESRKRAVGEACSAVESAMRVLLEESRRPLPKPANLSNLVAALIAEGLVESELKEMLTAAGFFGNRKGRHGAGAISHSVSQTTAEAVVASAAVALTYLAKQLP